MSIEFQNSLDGIIERDVYDANVSIDRLSQYAMDPAYTVIVAQHVNDLELAYSQLARLLLRVRPVDLKAAE